jgi:hypothetical protein
MRELGQPIPEPLSLDDVMSNPENAEAIPFPVSVRDHGGTGVEVNLTITEADLKKIDALARKQGKSRAALLSEAVRRKVAAETDHAA